MASVFPIDTRYFIRFRHSDTGLIPVFSYFENASTGTAIAQPALGEVTSGGGVYYFDWTWNGLTDPDVVFEVDGGPAIPTEEVRYVSDVISARDFATTGVGGGGGGGSMEVG